MKLYARPAALVFRQSEAVPAGPGTARRRQRYFVYARGTRAFVWSRVPATAGGGDATATGKTLTSATDFIAGAATGAVNATAAGKTLTSITDFIAGAASAVRNATAGGVTMTSLTDFIAGAAFVPGVGGQVSTRMHVSLSIGL